MHKWEYRMVTQDITDKGSTRYSDAALLWDPRNKDDKGKTAFDTLRDCGKEGWELVAVTPVATDFGVSSGGQTSQVLFTFKRPLEE
jgi:hypothetical protein